eukprot:CAMPEP_0201281710 /NCGR_PEP_ID=MMETSP1317-20130820/3861_1 /ASSEMBLY_ACC=CAM_ASM_000770 /TAXON_ID=187299 /ORGANISM="Undescribed Undescribed, Strain Undescribed" /LENGTH=63 /DNA_ID=CAMNT_0047592377 /DNA_START=1793 /DNA_END=1984 /DNA_ORIENTATION=+
MLAELFADGGRDPTCPMTVMEIKEGVERVEANLQDITLDAPMAPTFFKKFKEILVKGGLEIEN